MAPLVYHRTSFQTALQDVSMIAVLFECFACRKSKATQRPSHFFFFFFLHLWSFWKFAERQKKKCSRGHQTWTQILYGHIKDLTPPQCLLLDHVPLPQSISSPQHASLLQSPFSLSGGRRVKPTVLKCSSFLSSQSSLKNSSAAVCKLEMMWISRAVYIGI